MQNTCPVDGSTVNSFVDYVATGTLPMLDELYKRSTAFIQRCLSNDCTIVKSIAKSFIPSYGVTPSVVMLSYAIRDSVNL